MQQILTRSGIDYKIDEETRRVTATVKNCQSDFVSLISKRFQIDTEQAKEFAYRIRNEYTGVADCSLVDEFNVDIGMDIARSKALIMREEAFIRSLEYYISISCKTMNKLCNILDKRTSVLYKHMNNMSEVVNDNLCLRDIRKTKETSEIE